MITKYMPVTQATCYCSVINFFCKLGFFSRKYKWAGFQHGCSPRPAKIMPWPAPPHEINKTRGRSGAKLTTDSINTPFYYAHKLCLRGRKNRKIFSFDYVYRLCQTSLHFFFIDIPSPHPTPLADFYPCPAPLENVPPSPGFQSFPATSHCRK